MNQSPFDVTNSIYYKKWRDKKLALPIFNPEQDIIPIANMGNITELELGSIRECCTDYNFALYHFTEQALADKKNIHHLMTRLGVTKIDKNLYSDDDSLSSITTSDAKHQRDFIPYTTKPLSWHTDGYYNSPDSTIRSFILHCVQPALAGGVSHFIDHEMIYIHLRELNLDYITALQQSDAMTIPANIIDGKIIRPEQSGPVFSVDLSGNLHMRYSARKRNIRWKNDPLLNEAVKQLELIWDLGSPYIYSYTLQKNQGIINNNILHNRTHFVDHDDISKKRLLYRGRYYNRVT